MTDTYTVKLRDQADYEKACKLVAWLGGKLGQGWTLTATLKRTLDQNAKMWACLADISEQSNWHGIKLSKEDWKLIFLDALGSELRAVPNWEGTGLISLRSSSKLSKAQMSEMIELIHAYGAENGVTFKEE